MNPQYTPQMPTEDAMRHARERVQRHAADLTGAPEEFVLCHGIAVSQLFDAEYYLAENPDVADMDMDPIIHYVRHGAKEGRKPAAWFDEKLCPGEDLMLLYSD